VKKQSVYNKIAAYMPVITIFLLVAIWYAAALAIGKEVVFPLPHSVLAALAQMLGEGQFYLALFNSLLKITVSFIIALVCSVLAAVLSANVRAFEKLFYPLIVISRATPTMSIIFLCLLWFGKDISPVIVSFIVIFPLLYSSCLGAIRSCDRRLVEMSALYKVSKRTMVFKLYLPFVADKMFSEAVSILSLTVKLVIAAEALSMSSVTLGRIMQISNDNLETARLFAVTAVAIILSLLLELVLNGIRKFIARKRHGRNC